MLHVCVSAGRLNVGRPRKCWGCVFATDSQKAGDCGFGWISCCGRCFLRLGCNIRRGCDRQCHTKPQLRRNPGINCRTFGKLIRHRENWFRLSSFMRFMRPA